MYLKLSIIVLYIGNLSFMILVLGVHEKDVIFICNDFVFDSLIERLLEISWNIRGEVVKNL